MAVIQVRAKEFKLDAFQLRTVRPFLVDEVVLQEALGSGESTQEQIEKFLRKRVSKTEATVGSHLWLDHGSVEARRR